MNVVKMTKYLKLSKSEILNCAGFLLLVILLGLSIYGEALARDKDLRARQRAYKYEAPEVWQESIIDLPAFSSKSDFSQYQTRTQTGFSFYADVSSIKFGVDGVVRMSLLAVSPKDSVNITYEGFRCATREYKLYASSWTFDGNWVPARRAEWSATNSQTPNSYRSDLLEYYICDGIMNVNERRLRALLERGKMNRRGRGGEF